MSVLKTDNLHNLGNVKEKLPKEVHIIAQEIKIVKNLSCADLKVREKQLRKLKKWLRIRSASSLKFTDDDLLRIWKGLFYCFWLSDKPLVQENLAEDLAQLVGCFANVKTSLKFFKAFLITMCSEWFGLDQWRIDKFLMLIRRVLRYTFKEMQKANWVDECVQEFNVCIAETVLDNNVSGILIHLVEIFWDELAKVSQGNLSPSCIAELSKPFIVYMAKTKDSKSLGEIKNKIFLHLLWQSEMGREYQEKFEAWKEMGFPNVTIDELEKIEDESFNEINDKIAEDILDPRAGNVDVFIPVLPVDTKPITQIFQRVLENGIANAKSKKQISIIVEKYERFESGKFPLGIRKMPHAKLEPFKPLLHKTIANLENLDTELHGVDRNLKKLNKKKRKRILSKLDVEKINEENYETILKDTILKINSNGNIKKSEIIPKRKRKICMEWIEEEIQSNEFKIGSKNNNLVDQNKNKSTECKIEGRKEVGIKPNENDRKSEWDKPLEKGETEIFVPSKKIKLKEANKQLEIEAPSKNVEIYPINSSPFVKYNVEKMSKKFKLNSSNLNRSLPAKKRVKIALGKNMVQKPSEYLRQIRNSPQIPYDAQKKPPKSLLKPNQMPTPINPFYKKKIGFKLNDTF